MELTSLYFSATIPWPFLYRSVLSATFPWLFRWWVLTKAMTRSLAFLLAMHKRTLIEVLPIRQSDQAFFRYCSATIPLLFRRRSATIPHLLIGLLLSIFRYFSVAVPLPFRYRSVPIADRDSKNVLPPFGGYDSSPSSFTILIIVLFCLYIFTFILSRSVMCSCILRSRSALKLEIEKGNFYAGLIQ
jgi:hypothetical protein